KAYCNVTATGDVIVVDLDAATPTFTRLATEGTGGGYTLVHPGGRYVYTMQESPREGGGGVACQVGGVTITDAMVDEVVGFVPLRYRGPDCDEALAGTPAETANVGGHAYWGIAGDVLFVPMSGGFNVADARVDQVLVVDTSDPAAPVQRP